MEIEEMTRDLRCRGPFVREVGGVEDQFRVLLYGWIQKKRRCFVWCRVYLKN